ncbi:hypothetical protein MHI02_05710 [Oceanobacillus sp. FSL K6-0118]|uniref:hypothetical protein n=1 Tax=Oceanobacillus sp. FSL K6-0118 TaxID=2921418 RepID=UPI0030FB3F54
MSEKKLFTQDEVNAIVKERLAREKRKEIEVTDVELPEGVTDYKALAKDNKAKVVELTKKIKLLDAGVEFHKLDEAVKFIQGETEEEIDHAISILVPGFAPEFLRDEFKKDKPKPYADPSQKRSIWNPWA